MFKHWQVDFVELIKSKRKSFLSSILKGLLHIPSWGFQFIVACRNWAFDHHCLSCYSPPVPVVISIGNIVAGGTGKTPVTLMIAKEFYPDMQIAILSRGYKSPAEKCSKPLILCRGQGPQYSAAYCGDEPYLLAQNLPKAVVVVGKNRHAASNIAAQAGAQVILLDDGMQHRRLARDYEIVVINAQDPFGQGYFLPRGFLRDGVASLSRADLLILNHVNDREHASTVWQKLAPYTSAPFVATKMEVAAIWNLQGNSLPSIKDKRVGIFCGIAQPEHFYNTIKQQGAHIVAHHVFPDHHDFDNQDLVVFSQKCRSEGAEILVCTEKDRVKLTNPSSLELPVVWLQMDLTIIAGKNHWQAFITHAKNKVMNLQ